MKTFLLSTLLVAAQANFFRRHRGRNGFLGAGIRHSGENFHAVFALADVNDLGATSVEYFDCGTGNTSACMSTTAIGNINALSLGVSTPQTGHSVNVTTSLVGNSHLFEVEFTPSSVANHIMTVIDINGQDVMEESYVCNAGHKVETDGSCSPCPAGQYAELGAVACTACPDSSTTPGTGATAITDCGCPAGTYATANGCSACDANKYNAAGDHVGSPTTCDDCPSGSWGQSTSAVGSDEKSDCLCPAGTGGSSTGCDQCSAGMWDAGGDQAGQSGYCTQCVAGKYSGASGATSSGTCDDCSAGTYSAVTGATQSSTCTLCGLGKFSAATGATSVNTCAPCPTNSTTTTMGNDAITDCLCAAGYKADAATNTCHSCQPGYYKVGTSNVGSGSQCTACGGGKYLSTSANIAEAACELCGAGKSSSATGAASGTTCQDCLDGSVTDTLTGDGATTCTKCVAGKWSASSQTACADCGAGKWSDTVEAHAESTCEECGMGKWSASTGANAETTCTNCVAGKYLNTTGNDAIADCIDCPQGKVSVPPADALNDCQYRSLMYGYVFLVDAPNTCTVAPCACTKTCVQWHGRLIEGFTIAERGAAGIVEETDTTICGMLKQTGELIKQEGCTGN